MINHPRKLQFTERGRFAAKLNQSKLQLGMWVSLQEASGGKLVRPWFNLGYDE